MESGSLETEPSVLRQKLAGGLLAITVLVPFLYVPDFFGRDGEEASYFPLTIFIPVLGSALAAGLGARRQNRTSACVFGALGGAVCFWSSAYWVSGSRFTSRMELFLLTCSVGMAVFLLYTRLWTRRKIEPRPSTVQLSPQFYLLALGAFAVLTVWSIADLNRLERHEPAGHVFGPVASFYDRFGYWPAALVTPALGLLCACVFFWLNRRTRGPTAE